MKRRLAALLAGAMVITSLPMVSFAASDNRVTKVPTVKDDHKFTAATAPVLSIKEKDTDWSGDGETIRLKFENAKWIAGDDGTVNGVTYKKLTDTLLEVVLPNTSAKEDVAEIPLVTEITGEGDVKVTVDSLDSSVSAGTYTFAVAGSGATKVTVDDTVDLVDSKKINAIVIDELKVGTIGNKEKITLTLPANFEFASDPNNSDKPAAITVEVGAGFSGKTFTKDVKFGEYNKNKDKEVLEIELSDLPTPDARGSIVIKDLVVKTTDDSEYGDVVLEVSGDDISTEKVTVAKYVEYGVSVKVEGKKDVPELLSGRYEAGGVDAKAAEKDDHKLLKVIIEENVPESWWAGRKTEIKFADEIKVIKVKLDDSDNIKTVGNMDINSDRNKITLTNWAVDANEKGKIELLIWVSADANFEGDIVATVGGAGLPSETEVVLGKAIAPIKVTGEETNVNIGYKEVAIGSMEITESKAGALQRGGFIYLEAEDMNFDGDIEAEVTDGDLKLGDVKEDGTKIKIEVKRASTKASTIKVTGAKVNLGRNLPEGNYDLNVYGDAFLDNAGEAKEAKFDTDKYTVEGFIKVVTPAPDKGEASGAAVKASFTVGSSDYTVGSETATADAAPYIKDGRTMLPVKYVAYALGVDPQNIKWDQATKTATILGDRVIQVKVGSKELTVNGAVLTMDTAAEVKDGRTYLPIAWVASALNVPYSWDDATKTVTFN